MRSQSLVIAGLLLLALQGAASAQDATPLEGLFGSGESWLHHLASDRIAAARRAAMEEPLATDRPDFTEASSVVGLGIVQLETGYTYIYNDDSSDGSITHTHGAPETLWRIGIHEYVEFRLVWNYVWERSIDAGAVSTPQGAEDLTIGFKFALCEQDGIVPEAALVTHLVLPTGAREFRSIDPNVEFNLLYGWDLPRDFTLAGSTGVGTGDDHVPLTPLLLTEDRFVGYHQSVTVGIPLTDAMRMYLEYFGLFSTGAESNFPQNYVDGGITYLLNNNVQFDVRAGKGLNSHADDFFAGVGLSLRM
jgi:hypothetical protein